MERLDIKALMGKSDRAIFKNTSIKCSRSRCKGRINRLRRGGSRGRVEGLPLGSFRTCLTPLVYRFFITKIIAYCCFIRHCRLTDCQPSPPWKNPGPAPLRNQHYSVVQCKYGALEELLFKWTYFKIQFICKIANVLKRLILKYNLFVK